MSHVGADYITGVAAQGRFVGGRTCLRGRVKWLDWCVRRDGLLPCGAQVVDVGVGDRGADGWSLHLLGGFDLRGRDGPVEVPGAVQRLLAYIALQGGSVARVRAAADLWPGVASGQAAANLRSTLWRARQVGELVSPGSRTVLRMAPSVEVDVLALAGSGGNGVLPPRQPGRAFNFELLPDWFEDWVVIERERLRHVELRLLDGEAEHQLNSGLTSEALDTTLRAIRLEPLREASHQTLIRIFLRSGDRSAALSHYERFAALLREELDLGPDPVTTALVAPYLSRRRRPLGPTARKAVAARRAARPRRPPYGLR